MLSITHLWLGSADPDFLDLARREIVAADPEAVVQLLPEAPGLMWVCSRRSFADLAQTWQTNPPISISEGLPPQRSLAGWGEGVI